MTNSILEVGKRAPSHNEEIKINGLSLLFYDFYILRDRKSKTNKALYKHVDCPHHYLGMFGDTEDEHACIPVLEYTEPLNIQPIQLSAGLAQGKASLVFQLVGSSFLLTTTVINIDRLGKIENRACKFAVKQDHKECALTVDDVLKLIRELNNPDSEHGKALAQERNNAVVRTFGDLVPRGIGHDCSSVGIQIWDIDNKDLDESYLSNGIKLSHRFAWEIAALLECNSDVLSNDQGWRNRRPDQISRLVSEGTDVLADHRVMINRTVCLEISQVDYPSLSLRSLSRLSNFGYDSTSLFLWSYLTFQDLVLRYYSRWLSQLLHEAGSLIAIPSEKRNATKEGGKKIYEALCTLLQTKAEVYHALDSLCGIIGNMRERRHVDFFMNAARARCLDIALSDVERKLKEITNTITDGNQLLLAVDQRAILHRMESLSKAANSTKSKVSFLSYSVSVAQALVLPEFVGRLVPMLDQPLFKGSLGFAILLIPITLYLLFSKKGDAPVSLDRPA